MVESTSLRHSPPKSQSYESNSLVVITTAWAFALRPELLFKSRTFGSIFPTYYAGPERSTCLTPNTACNLIEHLRTCIRVPLALLNNISFSRLNVKLAHCLGS